MKPSEMRIADPDVSRVVDEKDILNELLSLPGASVLELGCGKADKTRLVAQTAASVLALEVDTIQLANNQASEIPGNVRFEYGGAEAIPAADGSFDVVMMFKSLHHVPTELMDNALSEIRRVLKPGGLASRSPFMQATSTTSCGCSTTRKPCAMRLLRRRRRPFPRKSCRW